MRSRQRGVTAIGWMFLMVPIAIVLYAGIRLAPLYLNYMKVARALDEARSEVKAASVNPQSIRTTIDRHFEIDMVDFPTTKDIKIQRDGGNWVVESEYEDSAPLFANVSLHVVFDKVVRIPATGVE